MRRFFVPAALLLLVVAACGAAPSPGRPVSEPYVGDLAVFDYAGRDEKLQVDRVMDVLAIRPGSTVADIGAGSGWFTVRAARRVGAAGLVYAVEINPEAASYIAERARREGLGNVRAIAGAADDARLPAGSVDAVLFLNAYHEVGDPVEMLRGLRGALRPGARVGIIDRDGTGADHGIASDVVKDEARRAGFEFVEQHDFVKGDGMDYFLVFRAAGGRRAVIGGRARRGRASAGCARRPSASR